MLRRMRDTGWVICSVFHGRPICSQGHTSVAPLVGKCYQNSQMDQHMCVSPWTHHVADVAECPDRLRTWCKYLHVGLFGQKGP